MTPTFAEAYGRAVEQCHKALEVGAASQVPVDPNGANAAEVRERLPALRAQLEAASACLSRLPDLARSEDDVAALDDAVFRNGKIREAIASLGRFDQHLSDLDLDAALRFVDGAMNRACALASRMTEPGRSATERHGDVLAALEVTGQAIVVLTSRLDSQQGRATMAEVGNKIAAWFAIEADLGARPVHVGSA